MNKIICEICGNRELELQKDKFVCQRCGAKYSTKHLRDVFSNKNPDNSATQPIETSKKATKEELFLQEIENAITNNDIEKALELFYPISDYDKAELIRCRLFLATGTISDPKFKEAINHNKYCIDKQGLEYLVVFVKNNLSLYRYLSVKYLIEYFLKHLLSLNCDTSVENVNKNRPILFDLFKSFGEVIAFCERNKLIWEFCLSLKERKTYKTEEEVKNAIEKIQKEVSEGKAENYYDFFVNLYNEYAEAANKAFLDKKDFDHDTFVLSFFNKFLEIII